MNIVIYFFWTAFGVLFLAGLFAADSIPAAGFLAAMFLAGIMGGILLSRRQKRQFKALRESLGRDEGPDAPMLKDIPSDLRDMYDSYRKKEGLQQEAEARAAKLQAELKESLAELSEQTRIAEDLRSGREKTDAHLRQVARQTQQSSNELAKQLRDLSRSVAEVGDGVERQKFSLQETAEAMELIAVSVADVSGNVRTASDRAHTSRLKARNGEEEARNALAGVEAIAGMMDELKSTMSRLGEQSQRVGSVMSAINEVADQTNLLALNAAIEAARAGEAGRGFSVVADEVRKLAEKTLQATTEIGGVVKEIQTAATDATKAVERAAEHAGTSVEGAAKAGELMDEIVSGMSEAAEQLASITSAVAGQAASSARTNESLDEISHVAASTAEHMQRFTSLLVIIAKNLEELDITARALSTGDVQAASENTRLIEWTPDLNFGIELIDSQHKMLCAYINSLHRAIRFEEDDDVLADIINCLKNYAVTHFSTEEQYFTHSAYEHNEKHKKIHAEFVRKVGQVERDLMLGRKKVGNELLEFLKEWLTHHIRVTDREYVASVLRSLERSKAKVQG